MVVILHGDGQAPSAARAPFRAIAGERDVGLFVPACPKDEGCNAQSYWRWNGDPSWLRTRVLAWARKSDCDPARIAIVGWSGGASYLGYRLHDLGAEYNVVGFLGGGMAPATAACGATVRPAYFLVGDKNPFHGLAKDLRAAAEGCGYAVTWNLLPGADHGGEWRAVSSPAQVRALFDFVTSHPRALPAPPSSAAMSAQMPSAPRVGAIDASAPAIDAAASPSATQSQRSGSGEVPPGRTHGCASSGLPLLLILASRRRVLARGPSRRGSKDPHHVARP
jgi:dienelactone hydrolase